MWRPFRRLRGQWEHGLEEVQVQGLEHLQQALSADQGVLIVPNHPTHADPYVLLEAGDRLGQPFYFMAAWQVFAMTHRLGRRVLRQHGCFSINREGADLRAFRQAVQILEQDRHPLIIFPEGEVFHLNDRVTAFRQGAARAAYRAARRSGRPVACIPCAIKFQYACDPTAELTRLMDRLEQKLLWTPRSDMPLAARVRRFLEGLLGLKEAEYLGGTQRGCVSARFEALISSILGRLEDRFQMTEPRSSVPRRIQQLRQRVIARLEGLPAGHPQREQLQRDLDDLFQAAQLYSYPTDYLADQPSWERLGETLDKLEEDVLGVRTASRRGRRRAVVTFGSPLIVPPGRHNTAAAEALTDDLQRRVQGLLDDTGSPPPLPLPAPQPTADDTLGPCLIGPTAA